MDTPSHMATGRPGRDETVVGAWRETYERLAARESSSLTPAELDLLADA